MSSIILKRPARGPMVMLNKADFEILYFLWRWKMAPTRLIHISCFKNMNVHKVYVKLLRLEKYSFVEILPRPYRDFIAWKLTKKGFQTLKENSDIFRYIESEDGFGSEHPRHDYLVTSFHLGDWCLNQPSNVQLITEQEIRRFSQKSLPDWVPPTSGHRADGYTQITKEQESTITAIEVELNLKTEDDYIKVFKYYSEMREITTVLWLVADAKIMDNLKKFMKIRRVPNQEAHVFVMLDDYIANHWMAKTISDLKTPVTVRNYYETILGTIPITTAALQLNYSAHMTYFRPAKKY